MESPATRDPLSIIVAMARNRVIGRGNELPWKISEDLKYFKRVTTRHAIIMGRKTYDSIGRPLPNRRNIVVSRREDLRIEGCEVTNCVSTAIALARATDPEPIVIGGAEIYAQTLFLATRVYVTKIDRDVDGDVFFPPFDESAWHKMEMECCATAPDVTWVTLERNS